MFARTAPRYLAPSVAATFLVIATVAVSSQSSQRSAPPFEPAVKAHLAAIAARDMNALLPTLTSRDALTMIAPNGVKSDTRKQFVDFHIQWFATQDDGKWEGDIVRTIESPALGHALIKYRYTSRGAGGQPQVTDSWLALTFALEDGSWRLVFDQNTLLAAGELKK